MKNLFKKSITLGFIFTLLALAGCNTMQGFGKDLQQGGKAIEKAVDKD